jgi:hypothetical protein
MESIFTLISLASRVALTLAATSLSFWLYEMNTVLIPVLQGDRETPITSVYVVS